MNESRFQNFDLAGVTMNQGAPSFAPFAKGGIPDRRQHISWFYVSSETALGLDVPPLR